MEPQLAYAPARGGHGSGHGETDADEMQHMWQFLDAALPTPPTAAHAPLPPSQAQAQAPPMPSAGLPPVPPGELDEALSEDDSGMYSELGDVFNNLLFFGLDDPQHPAQVLNGVSPPGAAAKYSEPGGGGSGSNVAGPEGDTALLSSATAAPGADGQPGAAAHKVQLPRSASASSSHSGVDSISPVGLLGYPSMSPATINWLQSLATSASSESLSGLISPATLYSGSAGGVLPGSVSGSAGGLGDSGKAGSLQRTPSCEMIDWKAYNEAVGVAERTQKEPAKWRVIPQHGPHADPPAGAISSFPGSVGGPPPEHLHAPRAELPLGAAPPHAQAGGGMPQAPAGQGGMAPGGDADGGLRTHLTRQFETIKSTVVSIVGALGAPGSPSAAAAARASATTAFQAPNPSVNGQAVRPPASGLSAQEQMHLAAKRAADDKNKRKAIISPEYVQYGSATGGGGAGGAALLHPALFSSDAGVVKIEGDLGHMQFATEVPDPTGRRPSKRSLHQAAGPVAGPVVSSGGASSIAMPTSTRPLPTSSSSMSLDTDASTSTSPAAEGVKDEAANSALVRCKCTGKCRNARCACVKAGLVCGAHCKCVGCANPFVPMAREGIDIRAMVQDVCLMQYLSKVKDMQELLDSTVAYECCDGVVQVKHTVEGGFTCPHCRAHYTYSWCSHKLCHDQKKPRKHCAKCRRCGDHRNEHCDACNHCYFAGVANSFSCSCRSGKPVTGSGVKARSAVPAVRVADGGSSSSSSSALASAAAPLPDLFGTRDENANGANLPARGASTGRGAGGQGEGAVATGLSGPDAEGDDACKMQ